MHPRDFSQRTPDDFDGGGGTPDTCGDFWRMCAHVGACAVVMLCQVQRGFTGCSQYFPAGEDGEVKKFATDLEVKLLGTSKIETNDFIVYGKPVIIDNECTVVAQLLLLKTVLLLD